MKLLTTLLALHLAWIAPAAAQVDLQAEQDELLALEWQIKVMRGMQDVDYFLGTARDHARPSDLAEKLALEKDNTGYFLRQAHKVTVELAKSVDPPPMWLTRYESSLKAVGSVRKIAGLLHGVKTIVEATMNADSSSGAEKLKSLEALLKDVKATVGPTNPLVSLYVGKMAQVVGSIAVSAQAIEAARDRTNDAIAMFDTIIEGSDYKPREELAHPLDDALEKAEARLRVLRRAATQRRFEEVFAAEDHCLKHHGTNRHKLRLLKRAISQDRDWMRRIRYEHKMLNIRTMMARHGIRTAKESLPLLAAQTKNRDLQKANAARTKLARARGEITALESLLVQLKKEYTHFKPLLPRLEEIKERHRKNTESRNRIEQCVAHRLESAQHADRHFVEFHFPSYKRRPPGNIVQEDGGVHQCRTGETIATSMFSGSTDGWKLSGDGKELTARGDFIFGTDQGKNRPWYFSAPAKFLGDKSAAYGHEITFELKQIKNGYKTFKSNILAISDGETSLWYNPHPDPPANGWTKFTVCFHESHHWSVVKGKKNMGKATAADFKRVLKNLKNLYVCCEHSTKLDVGGLRRVVMRGEP